MTSSESTISESAQSGAVQSPQLNLPLQGGTPKNGGRKAYEHHGMSGTKIYAVWAAMLQRCNNPNSASYPYYGGRGIHVCDRWMSFSNFYADMGAQPFHGATLERTCNSKGYNANNVKWATRMMQGGNSRKNRLIKISGETAHLSHWARLHGLSLRLIGDRLRDGWELVHLFDPVKSRSKLFKVSKRDIRKIRKLRKCGFRLKVLSRMFSISEANVSLIANKRSWKNV